VEAEQEAEWNRVIEVVQVLAYAAHDGVVSLVA
jgi:hypothetical protein